MQIQQQSIEKYILFLCCKATFTIRKHNRTVCLQRKCLSRCLTWHYITLCKKDLFKKKVTAHSNLICIIKICCILLLFLLCVEKMNVIINLLIYLLQPFVEFFINVLCLSLNVSYVFNVWSVYTALYLFTVLLSLTLLLLITLLLL